ncbi:calcineurin-binding protein cabin-1 isoform X2 [Folsomia candida]|uniref:calcineurin-binding protein cabin-1 isoform X2 n=1 Tax=Folsomia candida TaxID=158441 RepID=UPI001604C0C5|nr:calcineurin-binding protein cabin-1 isoform X2 [Folsomia candida]
MLKIRALNESSSSSEEEDEDNPRLSVEAQESQAKLLYEKAQKLTINQEYEQAVEIFVEILQLPYLNVSESEKKTLSPVQLQLRLGCLKCLSTLYTSGATKNLEDATAVLELITELEPKNVNFWYRLGKVALERKELELAYDAFTSVLDCSPGHWGSIENLVTISFALHDLLGCLRFCAIGLAKDSGFLKGRIFKNEVFKCHSWTEDAVKGRTEYESLFSESPKLAALTEPDIQKYISEARRLMSQVSQEKLQRRKEEEDEASKPLKCPFALKSLTLSELGNTVFDVYHHLKESGTLLRLLDLASAQTLVATSTEGATTKNTIETPLQNGNCSQELGNCASVTMRSRSTSDDKDPIQRDSGNDSSRPANDNSQMVSESEDKMNEDDSQSANPNLQGCSTEEEANSQRGKNRKGGVKWWQIEGQRRSQRVRGNMVTAPVKAKPANTFAEMLRNIIPEALLVDETNSPTKKDKNTYHQHQQKLSSSSSSKVTNPNQYYFGSSEENSDVKMLISQWKCVDILRIITQYVRWLARNCKAQWPTELRTIFTKLYHLYRNSVPTECTLDPVIESANLDVEDDWFTILAQAELALDASSCPNPTNMFLLENAAKSGILNEDFLLRVEWFKFKNHLLQGKDEITVDHSYTKLHLNLILEMLKNKPDGFICVLPTEVDFVISSPVIIDKLQYVQKIEKLSKIEKLYETKQFEDLVEILNFSLSVDSSDDVQNRIYLTESYFHLGRIECVEHCDLVLQTLTKNGSEEKLLSILKLLRDIWEGMKCKMETKEFKMMINTLLKILIRVEKQEQCSHSFLITEPWCLLHAVLYHLEQIESALFIDEETVPGSILILQLGHEILSKSGKCSMNEGHFLSYCIAILLELAGTDMYWAFEETKTCLDQAILCMYSHPSKKFKLKNLKDHGTSGIPMNWSACCQLYKYYQLDELPEFDSKPSKSISAEVENLFQRIITEMPAQFKSQERYEQIKEYIKGNGPSDVVFEPNESAEKLETFDIYYLLADFYFKNQDLQKAVEFYIWDLTVCPLRFDSWTAIALTKTEDVVSKINACDAFKVDDVIVESDAVIRCFQQSVNLDMTNAKVRIEFGSFLYALHSVFTREMNLHKDKLTPELVEEVQMRHSTYLLRSKSLFEPYKVGGPDAPRDKTDEDDAWINHYMLGKVAEKTNSTEPTIFISQYVLAGQLLHAKCSTYPSRINYYNPPDFALEALEIYFRIHASILKFIKHIQEDSNKECEDMLLKFLKDAEESPFMKSKQGRGTDGENKRKKAAGSEETISRREKTIINSVMQQILDQVETMVAAEVPSSSTAGAVSNSSSNSSTETTSSSEEDSNPVTANTTIQPAPPALQNLSLSAFRDRIRAEEESNLKSKISENNSTSKTPETSQNVKKSSPEEKNHAEKNPFFKDFASVRYGLVISMCLKAMKECVSRCPQYFKAFYKLANAYVSFKKDYKKAKEYLMGNNFTGTNKVTGLYGERKPSNFFNGIWRHPIEDIDRPGSFAFYMSKSMSLLLMVLTKLQDHQMLADVGIQLAKVPDSKNTYLYTEDREQYSSEAFKLCEASARKSLSLAKPATMLECGLSIYDTYTKFQKFNAKENYVAHVLLEVYKRHSSAVRMSILSEEPVLADAVRFFQQIVWSTCTKTSKNSMIGYNPPRSAETVGSKLLAERSLLNPSGTLTNNNMLTPLSQKQPIMKRRLSDGTTREETSVKSGQNSMVGPITPQPLHPMEWLNYDPSAADMMLAAQLASYNKVLQQQIQTFLTRNSSMLDMGLTDRSGGLSVDNNTKQNHNNQRLDFSSGKVNDENKTKKLQTNTNAQQMLPNPFNSDASSTNNDRKDSTKQMISNMSKSMTKRTSETRNSINDASRTNLQQQQQRFEPSSSTTTPSRGLKNKFKPPRNIAQLGAQLNKMQSEKTRVEIPTISQIQTLKSPSTLNKEYPGITTSKASPSTSTSSSLMPSKILSLPKPKPTKQTSIPPNLISPPYLSCSPFQAQATAMVNPAIPGRLSKNGSQSSLNSSNASPQPAHSQAVTQPRYSIASNLPGHLQPSRVFPRLTSTAPQPEVVDLTTKSSPEKNTNTNTKSSQQSFSTKSGLDITRLEKSSSNSQPQIIETSSVTLTKVSTTTTNINNSNYNNNTNSNNNNKPKASGKIDVTTCSNEELWDLYMQTHKPYNPIVTTTKSSTDLVKPLMMIPKPPSRPSITKTTTPLNSMGGGGITNSTQVYKTPTIMSTSYNPSPTVITNLKTHNNSNSKPAQDLTPKVILTNSNKNNNRSSLTSQNVSSSAPSSSSSMSRGQKRQLPADQPRYPLPPKKKHHIIPTSPPPVVDLGEDVEVITLE